MAVSKRTALAMGYFLRSFAVDRHDVEIRSRIYEVIVMAKILLAFMIWLFATGKFNDWLALVAPDIAKSGAIKTDINTVDQPTRSA